MAVPNQIISSGYPLGQLTFTYLISGSYADDAAIAATEGKAVSLDTSAANTVKLAADGDQIFGRVYKAERRAVLSMNVASVARSFKEKLPASVGHGIAVGDRVIGAGNGLVKKDPGTGATLLANPTVVVETGTDYVVVEKF